MPASTLRERITGFDWLRGAAIIAVVCIHSSDAAFKKNGYFPVLTTEGAGYFLFSAFLRFCVPVFFLMSAYLTEARFMRTAERPEARWLRFAIPLLAATVVYLLISIGQAHLLKKPINGVDLTLAALTGQAYYHIWFLYIALLYVVLHRGLRLLSSGWLLAIWIATGVIVYTLPALHLSFPIKGYAGQAISNFLLFLPYYMLGIQSAIHADRLRFWTPALLFTLLTAGACLTAFYGLAFRDRTFFTPGVILFSYALFVLSLRIKSPPPAFLKSLGVFSLGVYLWHPLFLAVIRVLEGRFYRERLSGFVTLTVMGVEIIFALIGSYLLTRALARYGPLRGVAQ